MPSRFAAIDLGAESGRVILAQLEGDRLSVRTVHQFPSPAVTIHGTLRWDVLAIWNEITNGLRKLSREIGPPDSVGVDSWGVDYVLCRDDEPMITLPFHYRDARCDGGIDRATRKVSRDEIFDETGIQFMQINTIYQLHDDATRRGEMLRLAERALPIADYFNWLLCGVPRAEQTLASTTQLYNPRTGTWSSKLLERLGIPPGLLPPIVPAGTVLGPVRDDLSDACGLSGTRVIATCSHDTAAAVAAVPVTDPVNDWAYLSSGTWSLLGAELDRPVINPESQRLNFTNEVGFGGTIRLLKNIIGLWPLQECRREWALEGKEISYADLTAEAARSPAFRSIVDLTDPRFLPAGQMRRRIADACRVTGQPEPTSPAQFARCVLESLALAYRKTLGELRGLLEHPIRRLHIVGGGSNNDFLNQMTADACGVTVVAGPSEATAVGNALVQAIALGVVKDLAHARRIVASSFELKHYTPGVEARANDWSDVAEKLSNLSMNHA